MLVCALVFTLIYVRAEENGRSMLAAAVDSDIADLAEVYALSGIDGLTTNLRNRLAVTPVGPARVYYRLEDSGGQRLAGNVAQWPKLDPATSESRFTTLDHNRAWVRVTLLRGGIRLLAARSAVPLDNSLRELAGLSILASLGITAIAFFIGLASAASLHQRVMALQKVLEDAETGLLSTRVPIGRDADELDDVSAGINRTLIRLEAVLKAQREIADNFAHETRTPLMQLDVSLVRALEHSTAPDAVAALEKARDQISKLLSLYDALLDIASATGQIGDMRGFGDVNLSETASGLLDLYRASAEDNGIELVSEITPGVVLRGDPTQLLHLIVNLLDNALKYGAAGRHIRVIVTEGPRLVVEDHGPGVPADDRERIFDRYQRVKGATTSGHGLGLALAKAIATRHGLVIGIEDAVAGGNPPGARFVVERER